VYITFSQPPAEGKMDEPKLPLLANIKPHINIWDIERRFAQNK
jgi:hypothetical protein